VEAVPCSDHMPLFLSLTKEFRERPGGTRFRYEERWKLEEGFHKVLEEKWVIPIDGRNMWEAIKSKLNSCHVGLARWQKLKGEPMQHSITDLQERLKELPGCNKEEDGAEMKATRLAL
jgi:hypothetical protein